MESICIVCGNKIDVEVCCSGYECGCMGQPIEPPVCDNDECYDYLMKNITQANQLSKFKTK